MDYISKLCLLPIQEAGRTSVLSTEWRFRWTTIPKLVFDEYTFQSTDGNNLSVLEQTSDQKSKRKRMSHRCKLLYAIFQVLLSHRGTIREFSLSMEAGRSCTEIDQFVHHLLLKNTVHKLTLDFYSLEGRVPMHNFVPSSIFSMTQLTELILWGCVIDNKPVSNGLSCLTTLYLHELQISTGKLVDILSKSPLLKTVTLTFNLNDSIEYSGDSTIIDFFEYLPVIEELSIWCRLIMCFAQDGVPEVLPTALVHLKYFTLGEMCFIEDNKIHMLLLLIESSPNLEELRMDIMHNCCEETRGSFLLEDYSDIWLEHLKEFNIIDVTSRKEAELDFVKLILAKSPVLKQAVILLHNETSRDEERQILKILLHAPRASLDADIIVSRYGI